jgi:hypothetical protein
LLTRTVHNIYCIGESHVLAMKDILVEEELTGENFLTVGRFIQGLSASNFSTPKGFLNQKVGETFFEWQLMAADGAPTHRSTVKKLVCPFFLAQRPFVAPPLVIFAGDVDINHVLFRQMGEEYDFESAETPGLPPAAGARPVPRGVVDRALDKIFAPLAHGVARLKAAGMDRIVLHGLPPRSSDDEQARRWSNGVICPLATRRKICMLANDRLRRIAADVGVAYLDAWDEIATDGVLAPEYDLDGLHLTRAGAAISVGKIAALLLNADVGGFSETRYYQLFDLARKRPGDGGEAARRFHDEGCAAAVINDFPLTAAAADHDDDKEYPRPTGNPQARPSWSGRPLNGDDDGLTETPLSPEELRLLVEQFATPDVSTFIEDRAGYDFTIYAATRVKFAAERPARALPAATPPRCLYGLLFLQDRPDAHLAVRHKNTWSRWPVRRGALLLLDSAAASIADGHGLEGVQAIRLCFGPRLPGEPLRAISPGGNHWPLDPFQYVVRGFAAWPPFAGDRVSRQAPP